MKYPNIIFFRFKKYADIDNKLLNNNNYNCSFTITDNSDDLNKLFDTNYHLLVTYGETEQEYHSCILPYIPKRFTNRWIHKRPEHIDNINEFNNNINYCYIDNVISMRENTRPSFSIFTTCYNSYDKIYRAYNSLISQTHKDWEWVIIDDSPDDKHFNFLREISKKDKRIRLYKRDFNSGNIGNVKNESIGLCRGKYILELDHDDIVLSDVLTDAFNEFEKNSDVGFIYMECANVYENWNNFWYSDFICKGYGGYIKEKYNNHWVNTYVTPNINNITLTALFCLPNHPRIWRKSVLMQLESYSEYLPICDDFEILLRTALSTKITKIQKLGYIQFMNNNNNNFSLIRNSEINRIGPQYIYPQFFDKYKVHDKMKQLNGYEDEIYINNHSPLWLRENYTHNYINKIINNDYDKQYCLMGINCLDYDSIRDLYENIKNDFIVLSNEHTCEELINKIEEKGFDRMKCYSLRNITDEQLENYFHLICKHNDNYEILYKNNDDITNIYSQRHTIINNYIEKYNKLSYLEIGVETGFTFNKIIIDNKLGVDPDPKIRDENIITTTSDEFFKINKKTFDVIFIDGMHQVEYVINDFNNSIKFLNKNGIIFIDDVFPQNEDEQYKTPINPIYENNILKYSSPWTGDVWKFIYYLLIFHKDCFNFEIFLHHNYRGVIKIIPTSFLLISQKALEIINNYDYIKDFGNYKNILNNNL